MYLCAHNKNRKQHMDKTQRQLYVRKLQQCVEAKLGCSIKTPKDFEKCRDTIFVSLHENISISTLKRIWGYVGLPDDYHPSQQSLNILSLFAGYESFDRFCSSYHSTHGNANIEMKLLVDSITKNILRVKGELDQLQIFLK